MTRFIEGAVDGMLQAIGGLGVNVIRESIENKDFSGDTRESVMWTTAKTSSDTESKEKLSKPGNKNTVYIGSADPVASYLEYGTGPHTSALDSKDFVAEIKAWAEHKGIPDRYVGGIITNIRKYGTKAFPYINKAKTELEKEIGKYTKLFAVEFVHKFNSLQDKATVGKWNLEVGE
jgi:hypothetical protein